MPSYTITVSTENVVRIIAALEGRREHLVGEEGTDRQLYIAWLRGAHMEVVNENERRVAQSAVAPDAGIVDIT